MTTVGPQPRVAGTPALPPRIEQERDSSLSVTATRATALSLLGVLQSNVQSSPRIGGHGVFGCQHKPAPRSSPRARTRNRGKERAALLPTAKTSYSPLTGPPRGTSCSCGRRSKGFRVIFRAYGYKTTFVSGAAEITVPSSVTDPPSSGKRTIPPGTAPLTRNSSSGPVEK